MGLNVRRIALSLLAEWESGDKYINLLLDSPRTKGVTGQDRQFLTALLYGTVERLVTLDYAIERLTGKRADKLAPNTRRLLRMGLYQLLYMQGVADHAAVSETVSLASHRGERGFVNAVLRQAQRRSDLLAPPEKEAGTANHLSVAYGFPPLLVSHFLSQYGESETEALLAAFNKTAPLCLRVNTEKTDRATLLAALAARGLAAMPTSYSPVGIRLDGSADPTALYGFDDGLFFIQDEASQIAVSAAEIPRGATVIDTCACPGGKSFFASMMVGQEGKVLSLDLHESKLSLIRSSAERLGLSNITVRAHDGRNPDPALCETADVVLCDAPCSGLGVLGKKADLRHRAAARTGELPTLQSEILSAAATYVKKGGTLLYTTCTLSHAENEAVATAFVKANPAFVFEDFTVGVLASQDGMLTLMPSLHGCDGFFIAKLRKQD